MNGNKLTRVLAVVVCAFMLIQCTALTAFAADISPEAVVYERPSVTSATANQVGMNYIYVDVVTELCDNDQTVIVYLTEGDSVPLGIGYAPVGGNKAEVKIGASDDLETGTYTIVVALNKAADVFTSEVFYIGVADVKGFFEAVNMVDVEASVVKEKLDAHYEALSVIECSEDAEGNIILKLTGDDYEALSDDAKVAFSELLVNGVNGEYSHGKGSYDAENSEDFIKEAYVVANYNTGDISGDDMAEFVYKFDSVIGFDSEDENLYGKIEDKGNLATVVKTIAKTVNNVDELKVALEQAAAVQIVNETYAYNLVAVVKANNDLFGVDEAEIKKLENTKKLRGFFCEEFKGTYYSVDEIQEAWEDAYKAAKKKYDKANESSGGNGSVGGGNVKTDIVYTQITDTANNYDPDKEISQYYTDMGDYMWTSDAVLNLTKAGILSGYGDKTFAPEKSLTRAEFMKMIVNVFGFADLTATSSFTDVNKDAWYYVYVASAEKLGIAQGYGNGLFGVNDAVTRQDAITIIYRAARIKGLSLDKFKASVDGLKDKADIASYAVEAVESLYNAGVYLDASEPTRVDTFEPTRNATRAYIAVVLNEVYKYIVQ